VLIVLAFGAIDAVRNVSWFGLATIMLLPAVAGQGLGHKPAAPRRVRFNVVLGAGAIGAVAFAALAILLKPASWFESEYDPRAIATVEHALASRPGTRVFADVRYSDWLLWHDPALAGHLAYDTRFEILSKSQLSDLASLDQSATASRVLKGYGLLVLDPNSQPGTRHLLSRPGVHVLLRDRHKQHVVVATQPVT
jgi:hypothetical protein